MSSVTLALETIPSTWIHPDVPPTQIPYDRVVGVGSDIGSAACQFATEAQKTSHHFVVPEVFARRLLDFFNQFLVDHDPEHPPMPDTLEEASRLAETRYNCHSFALAMQGEPVNDMNTVRISLRHRQVRYVSSVGNLALGVHGLVRHRQYLFVTHGFVGMGIDKPFCLQVMNNNSNMGLMPYDKVLTTFRHLEGDYEIIAPPSAMTAITAS